MLGCEARALLGELFHPIWMDGSSDTRIEPDVAQVIELFDQPGQGSKAWGTGRLTRPGQGADRGFGVDVQ